MAPPNPRLLRFLGSVTGFGSVIGSLVLIVTFGPRMVKLYRRVGTTTTHSQKIEALRGGYQWTLLWLAISDLLVGFAWAMSAFKSPGDDDTFCMVQGFAIEFGVVASAMWTACLSYELYRFTVMLKKEVLHNYAQTRYMRYLVVCWLVPVITTGLAAVLGEFASAGGWCWIKNQNTWLQLLLGYVPLLAVLVFLVVVYTKIAVWVHRNFKKRLRFLDELRKLSKLGMFPAVFFVVWFVPMIARLSGNGYAGDSAAGALPSITATFAPSQGWLNALVYTALNKNVRQQVCEVFTCKRRGDGLPTLASGRESLISDSSRSSAGRSLSTARSTVLTASTGSHKLVPVAPPTRNYA